MALALLAIASWFALAPAPAAAKGPGPAPQAIARRIQALEASGDLYPDQAARMKVGLK
jgi:hypothetical protein